MLEKIVQQLVGYLEAALEAQMELPVAGIHTVIILRVVLPQVFGNRLMESCCVLLEERLHLRNLQQPFIIAGHKVVPNHGAAFFYCGLNCLNLDDMILDLGHQLGQDHFIDAEEAFRIHQIFDGQFDEARIQPQLILN